MAKTPPFVLALAAGHSVDDHAIKVPPPGRLTLSAEARRKLAETILSGLERCSDDFATVYLDHVDNPEDDEWQEIEDALLEILMPVRYVTAAPRGLTGADLHIDTPANERGLTPLSLQEQIPGAWNFVEPRR